MKLYLYLCLFFMVLTSYGQDRTSNFRSKKIAVKDTVVIDTVSINPFRFSILDKNGKSIDSTGYQVDATGKYTLLFIFAFILKIRFT